MKFSGFKIGLLTVLQLALLTAGQVATAQAEKPEVNHCAVIEDVKESIIFDYEPPAPTYTGVYVGRLDLEDLISGELYNCMAALSYSGQFSVEQQGERVVVTTPSGLNLEGGTKLKGFRARGQAAQGQLNRLVNIRVKRKSGNLARITLRERVRDNDKNICVFKYSGKFEVRPTGMKYY